MPVFSGSAREAARHFPRHFNVAVTLGLAGIGLDQTEVTIRADGTLAGARHTLTVEADAVELEMTSQNFPLAREQPHQPHRGAQHLGGAPPAERAAC